MDRNVLIYSAAREYLDNIKPLGVSLDKYFLGDSRDFSSLKDIYIQFIRSAQNYQSMPKVIKFDERKERIAETKGTMESLELRPIEQAKISCAKKLFNEMSTSNVVYHDVDSYQSLLNIMNSL